MPYLKFSRDKRGYEHFFLMQPASRADDRRPAPRLLYWFRTPPNIRVGREPFDDAARRSLERQNPGVRFDWDALVNTPIPPPPEAEPWRERRRAERAARRAAALVESPDEPSPASPVEAMSMSGPEGGEGAESEVTGDRPALAEAPAPAEPGVPVATREPGQRRRRRRRRRGGGGSSPPTPPGGL